MAQPTAQATSTSGAGRGGRGDIQSPRAAEPGSTVVCQLARGYYFSLVTLTTMGYGDMSPVRPPATALVTLEAIFGQFYIAVVVAQLVGLRLAQALAPSDPPAR